MAGIYLESFHVKNIRLFPEVNISFNRRFNILAGPNGCGKTSVLACISHCFDTLNLIYSRFGECSELWVNVILDENIIRVGLGYNEVVSINYRSYGSKDIIAPPPPAGSNFVSISPGDFKIKYKICPLFIGSQRTITYKKITGLVPEKNQSEAFGEYANNSTKSIYGEWHTDIKQWIVNRDFMTAKDWAVQEKKNWTQFIDNLPRIAPFDSQFSYITTERDLEPKFSLYGKECYLEELSAGYQAVLSIIISIISWIEGTREGEQRDIKNAVGVVCIDEPDIHLHPEWQLTLREGLLSIFPNLQFIVTTHSPHLLASAGLDEIIRMPASYTDDIYNLTPDEKAYSGWTTDEILTDVMSVDSLENKDYERLVKEALRKYDEKDIQGLEKCIVDLRRITHPNNEIITVLQTRLASLMVTQK
jgi:energy-coupling factor transporter ATP-binding protein EcfA2